MSIDFATDCPHTIAEKLGLGYSGDVNTFDHGGYYYNRDNWTEHGYADCVEIYECDGRTYVQTGTINHTDKAVQEGYAACGWHIDSEDSTMLDTGCGLLPITPDVEIEAVKAAYGIESDYYDGGGSVASGHIDDDNEKKFWADYGRLILQLGS